MKRGYGIVPTGALVDLGGASNLNVLVLDGARRLVARVYRPSVSAARLGDLQHVRRRLAARGFPCLVPIAASDGSAWTTVGGRLVEVEEYVDHDAHMKTWQRVETGLRVLGGMHEVLSSIAGSPDGRAPRFVNHIAPEDVEEATARGAARIRSWSPTAEEARLADAAEELAQTISDQQKSRYAELPRQLVHGDFWDDNVLYRGGDIVLVHDFDHMSERARIDDLALTLYYLSSEPSADLERDGLRLLLRRLVDAYDSGLESGLSHAERIALPVALARQPLWSVGGWIADLDDDGAARAHAAGMNAAVEFARVIMRELPEWQEAMM